MPVICTPLAVESCYSGPPGTEGVGTCKAGNHACNDSGTAFGPCQGEVIPVPETCLTPGDEDCDKQVNEEGPGCACSPGQTQDCYNGPLGTQGIGACLGGVLQCTPNGTFDTVCMGEVLPVLEECSTDTDDDCDADVNEHCALWSKIGGNTEAQEANAVAVDSKGNVIISGYIVGAADFGGGPLTSQGDKDIFIAKFDSIGNHLWSYSFGDPAEQETLAIAVDSLDNIIIAGRFLGNLPFDPMLPLVSAGQEDIFLAKFYADGKPAWSKRFGDASTNQQANGVATDKDNNIVMTGRVTGTVEFAPGKPQTASVGADIFLAKFNADGTNIFSQLFGDSGDDIGWSVATGPGNSIAITGQFDEMADFGGGPLVDTGGIEAFVAVFSPDGGPVWSKATTSASDQRGRAVDFDSMGNVYVYGDFLTAIAWGGGEVASNGSFDLFLTAFDPMGSPMWNYGYGNNAAQEAMGMDVDDTGTINLICGLEGIVDFGGYPAIGTSAGSDDVMVAKLNAADASLVWVRRFGDGSDQDPRGIAADATGAPVVAGGFYGKLHFGTVSHNSVGNRDIFVAKLAP